MTLKSTESKSRKGGNPKKGEKISMTLTITFERDTHLKTSKWRQ